MSNNLIENMKMIKDEYCREGNLKIGKTKSHTFFALQMGTGNGSSGLVHLWTRWKPMNSLIYKNNRVRDEM